MLISHLLVTSNGTSKIKKKSWQILTPSSEFWWIDLKQYWRVIVSCSLNKGSMDAEMFNGPHDNKWDLFALLWSQVWLRGWIDVGGIILLVGAALCWSGNARTLNSEGRACFPQLPRERSPASYRDDQLQVWREVHMMSWGALLNFKRKELFKQRMMGHAK